VRVLPVHVQAVRAAVDLRDAHLYELEQLRIEAFREPGFDGDERLDAGVLLHHEV
jgi:hypothetical protein